MKQLLLALGFVASSSIVALGTQVTVTVRPSLRFQTITTWGAFSLHSLGPSNPWTDAQLGQMYDVMANDLGCTGIQFNIRPGTEGDGESWAVVNDNRSSNDLNPAGFTWTNVDTRMNRIVVPLRQRVLARGVPFYLLLSYVDFGGPSSRGHNTSPAEYAEFMVAVWRHFQSTYGFVPNGINIINEPDNLAPKWDALEIGEAIAAVVRRFKGEGLAVPEIFAPSTTVMANAERWTNTIIGVSGARDGLTDIGYHRYNMDGDLAALAARAAKLRKRTSMTEYWGETVPGGYSYDNLIEDLTVGHVSSWFGGPPFPAAAGSCAWSVALTMPSGGGPVTVCPNMKTVRQITHYVRPGATRIATSDDLWTVAFVNPDGTHVAVVKGLGAISVAGMPAGTYGVSYSTPDLLAQQLEDVTITAGQSLRAILPEPGVMTFYGKTAGALGRAVAASRERREDLLANERD